MVYEDFMPRIGLSLFMEFGVGLERQLTGHASGIRIYVPISPGTCLFMLFPILQRLALSLPRQGAYPSCRMKDMPASEKAGFRIRPLCRNIGGMIALCGIVFWTGGVEAFRSGSFGPAHDGMSCSRRTGRRTHRKSGRRTSCPICCSDVNFKHCFLKCVRSLAWRGSAANLKGGDVDGARVDFMAP